MGEANEIEIVAVDRESIVWPFQHGGPYIQACYQIAVDPTPGYGHDTELVAEMAALVARYFPPPTPLTIHVADVEENSRTNGCFMFRQDRDPTDEKWIMTEGHIFLSGKRIPPHPAMTRHLVAHEFGHAVEEWISMSRGLSPGSSDVLEAYAADRGVAVHQGAYGGRWHDSAAEVFACDFRLQCGVETEFWPHPGIERVLPQPCQAFWDDVFESAWGQRGES